MPNKKVLLAISGGVDSATAAYLLKKRGFDVLGVYFRLADNYASSEVAARAVCANLNIRFYPLNISDSFHKEIIEYFIKSYEQGQTPNPCVKCNRVIKFDKLISLAKQFNIDNVATGHYVRVRKVKNKYLLYKASDKTKDQSYFLYGLNQDVLRRVIFPLGALTKNRVKEIATKVGLPNNKKESQDICFLIDNGKIIPHNEFLAKHIKAFAGDIKLLLPSKNRTEKLQTIGRHRGLPFYTIGQRRGVDIGGTGPYYVARLDRKNNELIVVSDANDPVLFRDKFTVKDVRWIGDKPPKFPLNCQTVIRYRHPGVKCTIRQKSLNICEITLKTPQRAITSGQSAVFYNKTRVIGGAIIKT